MARYGVSIEKTVTFRGGAQPFSNVYFYEIALAQTAVSDLENLLDQLVTKEKRIHATNTSFTRGRVWVTGLGQAQNVMIVDKALSGAGSASIMTTRDLERAELIQIPAGVDSRGRRVYLRKWYHTNANQFDGSGTIYATTVLQQSAGIDSANLAKIAAFGQEIKTITVNAIPGNLVSQKGRGTTGNAVGHPYLEHHQLGDEWRGG